MVNRPEMRLNLKQTKNVFQYTKVLTIGMGAAGGFTEKQAGQCQTEHVPKTGIVLKTNLVS